MIPNSHDIEAFSAGSVQAFKQIYDSYAGKVYNYALSAMGDADLAEDITQNTFIQLWSVREGIDPERPLAPYLYAIARSMVCRELRAKAVANRYLQTVEVAEQQNYEMTVDDRLTDSVIEHRILTLLAELPEARRKIFMMRWRQGLTNKEVAEQLNISDKTVSTQIHRTVKFLRKKLNIS